MTTLLSGCVSGIDEQGYLQHQQKQLTTFIADTNIDSRLESLNSSAEKVTVQALNGRWSYAVTSL